LVGHAGFRALGTSRYVMKFTRLPIDANLLTLRNGECVMYVSFGCDKCPLSGMQCDL
jgi:hypothetical protein